MPSCSSSLGRGVILFALILEAIALHGAPYVEKGKRTESTVDGRWIRTESGEEGSIVRKRSASAKAAALIDAEGHVQDHNQKRDEYKEESLAQAQQESQGWAKELDIVIDQKPGNYTLTGTGYCAVGYIHFEPTSPNGDPATILECLALAASDARCLNKTSISYGKDSGQHSRRCLCDSEANCGLTHEDLYDRYTVADLLVPSPTPIPVSPEMRVDKVLQKAADGAKQDTIGAVGSASASILIGCAVTIAGLLYLVNYSDPDIKKSAWRTISNSVSLFCAVLIFKFFKGLMGLYIHDDQIWSFAEGVISYRGSNDPTVETVGFGFIRFAVAFAILEIWLLRLKHYPMNLAAWGVIGAHTVAFMGADAFATMQEVWPWRYDVGTSILSVLLTIFILATTLWVGILFRLHIARLDGEIDAAERRWEQQCLHSENVFFAFIVGLVIAQTCRFAIVGKVPHFHGPQYNNNLEEIHVLMLFALCFGTLVIIFDRIKIIMKRKIKSFTALRTIDLLTETSAMSMSWCLLFWGKWWFWYVMKEEVAKGDLMTGLMAMAVMFSAVSFTLIFVFDFIADRLPSSGKTLRSLCEAFELLVGLSWESCFMTAVAGATGVGYTTTSSRIAVGCQICALLCIVILPAWMWYILPRALDDKNVDEEEDQTSPEPAAQEAPVDASAPPADLDTQRASVVKSSASDDNEGGSGNPSVDPSSLGSSLLAQAHQSTSADISAVDHDEDNEELNSF